MPGNNAYLSLGSNMRDSLSFLRRAVLMLEETAGSVREISSVYQTEPWGEREQEKFLNIALRIETDMEPRELLNAVSSIEEHLGRVRDRKWGPRLIDIDILFYNDLILRTADLIIPHPLLQERNFVLVPLHEICPTLVHPVLSKDIAQLLSLSSDQSEVILTSKKIGL
jgi:2-amino-4-hydroxy-6-hydroxymethyldihydropteridine diphosphokinase